jgi:hypothetical protein
MMHSLQVEVHYLVLLKLPNSAISSKVLENAFKNIHLSHLERTKSSLQSKSDSRAQFAKPGDLFLSKHPDPSSDWCYEEVLGRLLTLTARLFSVRHKVDKIGVDLGMFGSTARMASTAPALAIFIAFPYA